MTPTPESAKMAHHNGKFGESFISSMIPGFVYKGDNIDGFLDGKFAEVKSCQYRVKSGKYKRAGRMFFTKEQWDGLVKEEGSIILLVQDDLKVIHSKIIKASLLFDSFDTEFKDISWTKLFNISIRTDKQDPLKCKT